MIRLPRGRRFRRGVPTLVLVVAVAAGGALPAAAAPLVPALPTALAAPQAPVAIPPALDPGTPGPSVVDELSYDLGDEAFGPEDLSGSVELRAVVYAPQVIVGRAPVVVLLHGRHVTCGSSDADLALDWPCPAGVPEIPSFRGYGALGRNLASHGMVVISIGANGINAVDGYEADGGASARGQLVLEHLRRLQAWDASPTGSPFGTRFVGHLDLTNVGLMGHSRGGEGVVAAAQLNQRIGTPFGIRAVLALAPVDFGRRVLGGVPLGVVLPFCDGDVSDLQGTSYYDDARYASPGDPAPKLTALVYGANHNFFNTVWSSGPGSSDDADWTGMPIDAPSAPGEDPCRPGGAGRLSAPAQEQGGAVLMAGFFRRYLQDEVGFQRLVTGTAPFPASAGPARWSVAFHAPQRLDVERWDTPATSRINRQGRPASQVGLSSGLVCNPYAEGFLADPRLPATTCPSLDRLGGTNDTGVLDAGWVRSGAALRQPLAATGTDVTAFDGVRFRAALPSDSRNDTRAVQDLSVVLEDADGNRSSVAVAAGTNALRRDPPGAVVHRVLNGVRVPLAAFTGVDLTRVRAVELRFDRTGAGRIALSDLAFTQEGTEAARGPTAGAPSVSVVRPPCRRTEAARWACSVHQLVVGRDPSAAELARFVQAYASVEGRRQAVRGLVGGPTAARLHEARFVQRYTQADVDIEWLESLISPAGRARWEIGLAEITAGFAYSTPGLGSTRKVIDAAYESFTGAPADPGGLAYWSPRVEQAGPLALASSLARTASYRGRIVDERYRQIVGAAPDPAGRSYWVRRLATPGGEQALVASLLDTTAYRVAAIA